MDDVAKAVDRFFASKGVTVACIDCLMDEEDPALRPLHRIERMAMKRDEQGRRLFNMDLMRRHVNIRFADFLFFDHEWRCPVCQGKRTGDDWLAATAASVEIANCPLCASVCTVRPTYATEEAIEYKPTPPPTPSPSPPPSPRSQLAAAATDFAAAAGSAAPADLVAAAAKLAAAAASLTAPASRKRRRKRRRHNDDDDQGRARKRARDE